MPEDNETQGRVYRPNTFQMPNAMIDVWLTELTGSEFKVAAYILPIERASKIEFVVNLKTAQAIGVTVPQSFLQQATEIIQ
jgi:hypothetical protein